MNRTKIEWVKNPDGSQGYTLNPVSGCKNHTPEGLCLGGMFPCYAYRLANGRLKPLYLANTKLAEGAKGGVAKLTIDEQTAIEREGDYADPFYPRFWESRIQELAKRNDLKPRGIFVSDMGELFGDWIPANWQWSVFEVIKHNPQHRFYLLTKQSRELHKFSPFPPNCWVGVTATNYKDFVTACGYLGSMVHKEQASVVYLSLEPLLSWEHGEVDFILDWLIMGHIDWLIIGACTGTWKEMAKLCLRYGELTLTSWGNKWTAQPKIEWVEEIVRAAGKAGIPVFLKDNLYPLLGLGNGRSICHNNEFGTLRQEMPK